MNIASAEIVGNVLGGVLYGVHCTLFAIVVIRLCTGRRHHPVIVAFFFLSFVLSTSQFLIDLICLSNHFIVIQGVICYHYDPFSKCTEAISYNTPITGFVCDSFLIWRLYVVSNRRLIVCTPSIIFLAASQVIGYIGVYRFTHLLSYALAMPKSLLAISSAMFILPIILNITTTVLTGGTIWLHKRRMLKILGSEHEIEETYGVMVHIVVDSGVIYTLSLIVMLIFDQTNIEAFICASRALVPLAGLVPTAMIILSTSAKNGSTSTSAAEHQAIPRFRQDVGTGTHAESIPSPDAAKRSAERGGPLLEQGQATHALTLSRSRLG